MDGQSALVVAAPTAARSDVLAFLRSRGYACVVADAADDAVKALQHQNFSFSVVDLRLASENGRDVVQRLKAQRGEPGPILGLAERAGEGALDHSMLSTDALLQMPVTSADIDKALAAVLAPARAAEANLLSPTIQQEIDLWQSPKMRELRQIVSEAAGVDVTVLITGETGSGKDVVARAIHYLSARRSGPFVKVNCAAVPHDLLESELFGHERGSFTGAHKLKIGKFEAAHEGTIFLDEIGDLHPVLQAKLLHVLQDGDFARVGGKSSGRVDVRVIAATNQDLERAVSERRFREDLFYRLNVIQVSVPPLRERAEEIPEFIDYFVRRYSKIFGREGFVVSPDIRQRLLTYEYRGNVRELENLIKRMIVLGDSGLAPTGLLRDRARIEPRPIGPTEVSLRDVVRRASLAAERDVIRQMLDQTGWNRVRAAKALHISYRALLYKMKRVGLRDEALRRALPVYNGNDDRAGGLTS